MRTVTSLRVAAAIFLVAGIATASLALQPAFGAEVGGGDDGGGGDGLTQPTLTVSATPTGTAGVAIDGAAITATLSGATSEDPDDTILFYESGPSASAPATCPGDLTQIGSSSANGNQAYPSSGGFTPASAGDYWIYAFFSGDSNNYSAATPCPPTSDEEITVSAAAMASPTISSSVSATPAALGSTLNDSATLANVGTLDGSGSITFSLYGPGDTNCASAIFAETVDSISSDGPFSPPDGYVADASGTYDWTASFSGDGNDNAVSTSCGDEPVVVNQATPTISPLLEQYNGYNLPVSTWTGNETGPASVTLDTSVTGISDVTPTGTVDVSFFNNDACIGDVIAGVGDLPITGGTTGDGWGGLIGLPAGPYSYQVSYSGDSNYAGATSDCESFTVLPAISITSTPNVPSVPLHSSTPPVLTDTASIAGGDSPTGSITFTLTDTTTNTVVDTETVTDVDGGGPYTTPNGYTLPTGTGLTAVGLYQWNVSYSGDANNAGASDNNDPAEQVTVSPATPTVATTPSPLLVAVGNAPVTLTDSATLGGGYFPTGTITFTLYYGSVLVDTESVSVSDNGKYATPNGYTLAPQSGTVTGLYQWGVTYSGDANNAEFSDSSNIHETTSVSAGSESTMTTLTVSHPSLVYGSSTTETLSGTVMGVTNDGYPEGTVNVTYGPSATLLCSAPLLSGAGDSASYTCSASSPLGVGNYANVVATYVPSVSSSSNANYLYAASTSSPAMSFAITKDATSTSVKATTTVLIYGNESVELFSVKVTTHNGEMVPNGEHVTVLAGFSSCVVTLTAGAGTCSIANTALPAGGYLVAATYLGDANLFGSVGLTTPLLVQRDSTTTSVTELPSAVTYGHESAALFSVKVTTRYGEQVPNGEDVLVNAGFSSCVATLSSGVGTCSIANSALGVGAYPVVANYAGDFNLSGSSGSTVTRLVVGQDATTTTVVFPSSGAIIGHESSVSFSVSVVSHSGEPVFNGEHVTVHVGTVTCLVTLFAGHGSCSLSNSALKVGSYSVSASYSGDPNLTGSSTTSSGLFSVKL